MKLSKIISVNPGKDYETIGEMPISTHVEIDQKVAQARSAQVAWYQMGFKKRNELLKKLYDQFVKRKDEIKIVASREMGMPVSVSETIDIVAGLQYMSGYLDFAEQWLAPEVIYENEEEIHYQFFEPRGVTGISIPWNFPFCNFVWGVIQNLVVGNTVVFKHSEECILTGKLLEDIVQLVGLPAGVFNEVYGDGADTGEYLMNNAIDTIYFTGSTRVGKHLYQVAAQKFIPVLLELGGSAPGIVFDDAQIDITLESIYFNRFVNSGQTCDGLKRLIVQQHSFDNIVSALKKLVITKKMGNPEDSATDIGPLVSERQLSTLKYQVNDALKKGAKVILGADKTNLKGAYYPPTILTGITRDMLVWREEVFGPVLPVVSFNTEDDAIELANDTSYGLGAYIYTQDKERALRVSKQLKTGDVSVNAANYIIAQDPFGGYKNSGLGREHGKQGLRELCFTKVVALKK